MSSPRLRTAGASSALRPGGCTPLSTTTALGGRTDRSNQRQRRGRRLQVQDRRSAREQDQVRGRAGRERRCGRMRQPYRGRGARPRPPPRSFSCERLLACAESTTGVSASRRSDQLAALACGSGSMSVVFRLPLDATTRWATTGIHSTHTGMTMSSHWLRTDPHRGRGRRPLPLPVVAFAITRSRSPQKSRAQTAHTFRASAGSLGLSTGRPVRRPLRERAIDRHSRTSRPRSSGSRRPLTRSQSGGRCSATHAKS